MSRPKIQPDYNAEKVVKELINAVVESYEETGELKITANEFNMSPLKIRKMLITAGVYHSEVSDEINELYSQGKSVSQIMEITGLKKSSINGYLPYSKVIYKPEKISLNAARIKVYRERKEIVDMLQKEMNDSILWRGIVLFQKYPFHTFTGLPFSYTLKIGKGGEYTKELLVNRRNKSKSLTWSSVELALEEALKQRGKIIKKPKDIGDIRGISYLYPIFYRIGLIDIPEQVATKIELTKRQRQQGQRE